MPTITEALADIQIIQRRITKKREFINTYLARLHGLRDPLERQGGSAEAIRRQRQAIHDLQERLVGLRALIARANMENTITVGDETRSIFDWLTWKREIAEGMTSHNHVLRRQIDTARSNATRQGFKAVSALSVNVSQGSDLKDSDVEVNINEDELAKEAEAHEVKTGKLDGQLSLKNATIQIDYSLPEEDEATRP